MPVLQTTIRDCRLKSMDVTYSQRSQQREMNKYFITSVCRTGVVKPTSFPPSVVTTGAAYKVLFPGAVDITGVE